MEIRKYIKEDGSIPVDDWLNSLRDTRARARLLLRIDRLRLGLPGDHKSLGSGLSECRISEGKGYRLYFAKDGNSIILLLLGGNKSTQQTDIQQAKAAWKKYKQSKHHDQSNL